MKKNIKGLVYVQGSFMNRASGDLLVRYGFDRTSDIDKADVLVLTGGEDINPYIYGEPSVCSYYSLKRDREDLAAIKKFDGKFKIGICRGAQLLNCVPNDGKLWQDVDGHGGGYHEVLDKYSGKMKEINSLHHQALRPNLNVGEIIAHCTISTSKLAYKQKWTPPEGPNVWDETDLDVEAVWYPKTKSLCVQWHPEFNHDTSTNYFYELMERLYAA